jgi:N4-(beta-N-acetylglucosaminyl)-L-asparaginase
VRPIVIADLSGFNYRNGGSDNAVERAFERITEGKDVLDALIEGVNIPELDPEETGIGYGSLPNADGVIQLDASCMHGPRKRAGAVAAIEGVRTPSIVARAVADYTDHHLIAGTGAQDFARAMGIAVEADLNTARSRQLWLEWRRRLDPERWLDPNAPARRPPPAAERDAGFADRALEAGRSMVRDGLIPEGSFWGTIKQREVAALDPVSPDGYLPNVAMTWDVVVRDGVVYASDLNSGLHIVRVDGQ